MSYEDQVSATVRSIGWIKGEDYRQNFGQSIGANSTAKVFDLNNREIYGNTTFKFKDQGGENGVPLMVAGNLSVDRSFCFGNSELNVSDEGLTIRNNVGNELNLYPSTIENVDELTPDQVKRAQTVAVKGDVEKVENKIEINRQQMIAFLEIIKYIPELASKRESINNLIRSLEEAEE